MSFGAFRLLVAALLALSLAGKLVASRAPAEADGAATAQAAATVLRQAGFEAQVVTVARSPRAFARAARGRCRVIAGDYPPHGTFDTVYRAMAAPIGRLRFVHRGVVVHDQPKLRGLLDYYVWRELGRIGVAARRSPVIALIASDDCPLERLDWRGTTSLAN